MTEPLEGVLNAVCDEASFVRFVRALAEDFVGDREEMARDPEQYRYSRGPRGWENGTIDAFLERGAAWVEDSGGRLPVAPNPWRRCADILYAGKYYE